jgi:hypothetical protein
LPFKLIALDVDGTLLRSDGTISARTRAALSSAIQNGLTLTLATGRRKRSAQPIQALLDLPHYLVASQGAVVYDRDEIVAHAHLPRAGARIALEHVLALGMSAVMFANAHEAETIWITGAWQTNRRLEVYTKRHGDLIRELADLQSAALDHDPIEIVVFDEMERLEQLHGRLLPFERDHLFRVIFSRYQFTAGGAVEVVGPGTSKAAALDALCSHLGHSQADVIAFGDNVNDVEMLEAAGLGVCMANGTDDARSAADRLTLSNDEDGIAVVLEELGLA